MSHDEINRKAEAMSEPIRNAYVIGMMTQYWDAFSKDHVAKVDRLIEELKEKHGVKNG
jgi:predicted RND superfamily exporter protein